MRDIIVRRAREEESDAVAALFRLSKETAMPYLPDLHTAQEDRTYFRERVFAECEVWLAERDGALAGFCAFRTGWIDQLYVHPALQHGGVGTALLRKAKDANARLQLWAFQRNANALRFYASQGLALFRTTDGSGNEEREPDGFSHGNGCSCAQADAAAHRMSSYNCRDGGRSSSRASAEEYRR